MNEYDRYSSNSGCGENTEWEMRALNKCYPTATRIEKINDIDLQRKGVDYRVYFGNRHINVDCKVHHFASEIFVYECYDTRPNYKNYGWTNTETKHLTDQLVWIIPFKNECFVYNFKDILNYRTTREFELHEYAPDTKHSNGVTRNKYFWPGFIPYSRISNLFYFYETKPSVSVNRNYLDLNKYCN